MTHTQHELDVRPILRAGGEPFMVIMDTVSKLDSSQALRLLATFEPVPLYGVLAKKGFAHAAQEIGSGDWEVVFTRTAAMADSHNRDLEAPQPMVRTPEAVGKQQPGEVLSALLCREPVALLPKRNERGH